MASILEQAPDSKVEKAPPRRDPAKHAYCWCREDVALCGYKESIGSWRTHYPPRDACVVCLDIYRDPCPHCGLRGA